MIPKKKILKFEDFTNENFGLSGYGLDGGAKPPIDMGLNPNSYHTHKSQMEDQLRRLQNILSTAFLGQTNMSKSKFNFEIKDLTIIRIFPNNSNSLDVYFKFIMDDYLYYATFKNWGGYSGSKFESPVLKHPQIQNHLENAIKLEGLFKQILIEWFRPELGEYQTLKQVKVYDEYGNIFFLPENGKITVDEVLTEEDKPIIYLIYSDRKYFLTDLDYYFFHWWFIPKEQKKFYI